LQCKTSCIKNGFQSNGKQRYYCKICKYSCQEKYTYNAYLASTNKNIYLLLINSCGITDISRILQISRNTIRQRILLLARKVKKPSIIEYYQSYEMDELSAKVNGNWCYIAYAINRKTKTVIDFTIGNRTSKNLSKVITKLLLLNPKRICTDGWAPYKTLIPKDIHIVSRYQTNRIERLNLNLRTHLKRLNRKTICYSKCIILLSSIIKIYFWGNQIKFT
jgi:IS1 family transposase/transposase-like protein